MMIAKIYTGDGIIVAEFEHMEEIDGKLVFDRVSSTRPMWMVGRSDDAPQLDVTIMTQQGAIIANYVR